MNCEKYSRWISLYIDRQLDGQDLIELEKHISLCDSCRDEVVILQEIMDDMKDLKAINPPEKFHNELMGKINAISNPRNKWNFNLNLKLASAVAAVFIIAAFFIDPFKTNISQEAAPEKIDHMIQPRMIMEEVALETWLLEAGDQEQYKEAIIKIGSDIGAQVTLIEELVEDETGNKNITMEVTLESGQKKAFASMIRKINPDSDTLTIDQGGYDQDVEDHTMITLLIIID